MGCDELSSNSHLRSVFTTKELSPFLSGLPEADSVAGRVDSFIKFGLSRRLVTDETLIINFLKVLKTRISKIDQRHNTLVNLIWTITNELSPDVHKQIGKARK